MKYARCKLCRSELVKTHTTDWEHVYARANKYCPMEIDMESVIDIEKW